MIKTIINKDCTITRIGTINNDDLSGSLTENVIELSEKNFRILMSILPKTTTHNAMNNELQSIKDLCTTLQMKSNLKRTDIIEMLTSAINYTQFMSDLTEFHKTRPDIKIVGKIDLSVFNDEIDHV